jgi:hypothetical protein
LHPRPDEPFSRVDRILRHGPREANPFAISRLSLEIPRSDTTVLRAEASQRLLRQAVESLEREMLGQMLRSPLLGHPAPPVVPLRGDVADVYEVTARGDTNVFSGGFSPALSPQTLNEMVDKLQRDRPKPILVRVGDAQVLAVRSRALFDPETEEGREAIATLGQRHHTEIDYAARWLTREAIDEFRFPSHASPGVMTIESDKPADAIDPRQDFLLVVRAGSRLFRTHTKLIRFEVHEYDRCHCHFA